jgi:hypothetical protein
MEFGILQVVETAYNFYSNNVGIEIKIPQWKVHILTITVYTHLCA